MSKNSLSKIITKVAIVGASLGAIFAIYSKYKKINDELNDDEFEDDDDFDNIDFDKIDKDKSSRDYVSININERKLQPETSKDDSD